MARAGAKGGSRSSKSGEETKSRIIDAALESLREDGIMGASARAIARRGDFNQALIFYHFDGLNDLFLAAFDRITNSRTQDYGGRLHEVGTLADIVELAGEIHREELADGHVTVLVQLLAGVVTSPEMREPIAERFTVWLEPVETALKHAIGDTQYAQLVSTQDLSYLIVAVFLGLELMLNLEDDAAGKDEQIFGTLTGMARLLEVILQMLPTPPKPTE